VTRALLLIGGYTTPRGEAAGISLVAHDRHAGALELIGTTPATSPSSLAVSGNTVFAVEETRAGRVRSFHLNGTALSPLSTQDSGGADPCHLLIFPSGRHLLTANYTSGSVAAHPFESTGVLAPASDLVAFTGSGPALGRQDSAHTHHVAVRPGTDEVAIADLGADAVHRIRFDDDTGRFGPRLEPIRLHPGCGPRQVVFAADGRRAFVLGELDSTVTTIDWTAASGPSVLAISPALRAPTPVDNLAATLLLAADGATLYASHRGADLVAVLTVTDTNVRPIADIHCGGHWPRHIAVDDRWLYITNERSDEVVALHLDDLNQRARIQMPSPAFVMPTTSGAVQ
jgi:6-phosphogluconolactonase